MPTGLLSVPTISYSKDTGKEFERFMESQAFSPSHGFGSFPLSRPQVSLFLGLPKVELTDMGVGGGGERAWSSINHSILYDTGHGKKTP